jgi:hypothetical protein
MRCLVCSFTEIRTDEVVDRGVVLLHECPRCDHRWTEPRDEGCRVQRRPVASVRTSKERTAA